MTKTSRAIARWIIWFSVILIYSYVAGYVLQLNGWHNGWISGAVGAIVGILNPFVLRGNDE
jgi:uncharacterized membrane protein AbrB (regulator of aidB expression)